MDWERYFIYWWDSLVLLLRRRRDEEPQGHLDCKENNHDGLQRRGRELLGERADGEREHGGADLAKAGTEPDRGGVQAPRDDFGQDADRDRVTRPDQDTDQRDDDGISDQRVGEPDRKLTQEPEGGGGAGVRGT